MSWLSLGLGYALLYAIGGRLLAGQSTALAWFGIVGVLLPAILILVLIVHRRRDWVGCQWLFWATIGIGFVLWITGHVGWSSEQLLQGREAHWLSWHTVFSLVGGVAPLLALLARPHLGARHGALATTAVDIAGFAILTGFVYAYFILIPGLDPGHHESAQNSLLLLIQVQRFAILGAMITAAFVARATAWAATYRRLAVGYAIGSVMRGVLSLAIVRGAYEPGSLYDLAWIAPFFFTVWAIAESPASEADVAATVTSPSEPWLVVGALALVPLVGYGGYYLVPLGMPADGFRVLLTTLTVVAGLALLTARMTVQRAELRRADARLRLLAAVTQQTGDLVVVVDPAWRVREVNDAYVDALGYSREELGRMTCLDLTASQSHATVAEAEGTISAGAEWRGTLVRRRKDGSTFPSACTIGALRDEAGKVTHFVAVERNMTEELRVRDQLIQSERLAAVGEVIAGVAHEINNPLQAILGCTELLLDVPLAPDQARRDLETVRREAGRAGQIVRNLLAFVHRGAGERAVHDLNAIVHNVAAVRVYHLRQTGIELEVRCHPEPLPVRVTQDEIRQVLLNLILNAEHAITGSGRGSRITVYTWRDAQGIAVQVADDGPGVSPEIRARIFEPFFTTRRIGEGTGLGLSISLGIAIAHGGRLEFAPSPEGGASFRLTLPPYEEEDQPVPAPADAELPAAAGGPRALVIDDEEAIRSLLVRLLERRGFSVLQAADGDAASVLLEHAPFDVVVCDAQLPRVSGAELFTRARARRPELGGRFILVSEDGAPLEASAARAGLPVLVKPFTAAQLDDVLKKVGGVDRAIG